MLLEDIHRVIQKVLARALSAVYISIGFFMVLLWLWSDYVGVVAISVAYLVAASILYSHVFRPLIRYHRIYDIMGVRTVDIYKILGFTASVFGLLALLLSIMSNYFTTLSHYIPLLGLLAIIVSIAMLTYSVIQQNSLFRKEMSIMTIVVLGATLVLYTISPNLVLPIVGTLFMSMGMYSYWLYYLKDP